ncbi:hypothetical protein GN244_ATG00680 [Phytophthora infestans]|uniref:Uncharacterized protein n=1 Tax=Phytophthora infestans TaxID=4787 RepID=A0A833WP10_PHYIN|nr:hypothetical protein GN244_ATG00680 [Phytophthora infestans]KAF4134242.1 hypothetical protein GN958_ATG16542 [Phytophthora infestans]
MLIPAKEVQSTKNIATDLESSLINTWIIAKKIPAVVRKQLGADEASAKLLTTHTTAYLILHR